MSVADKFGGRLAYIHSNGVWPAFFPFAICDHVVIRSLYEYSVNGIGYTLYYNSGSGIGQSGCLSLSTAAVGLGYYRRLSSAGFRL